ncbi:hypothetical protein ACTXT7_014313 [Hymenolepis weldensis]
MKFDNDVMASVHVFQIRSRIGAPPVWPSCYENVLNCNRDRQENKENFKPSIKIILVPYVPQSVEDLHAAKWNKENDPTQPRNEDSTLIDKLFENFISKYKHTIDRIVMENTNSRPITNVKPLRAGRCLLFLCFGTAVINVFACVVRGHDSMLTNTYPVGKQGNGLWEEKMLEQLTFDVLEMTYKHPDWYLEPIAIVWIATWDTLDGRRE